MLPCRLARQEAKQETYKKDYVALQQHNEGSVVKYRKLMVKPLDKSE